MRATKNPTPHRVAIGIMRLRVPRRTSWGGRLSILIPRGTSCERHNVARANNERRSMLVVPGNTQLMLGSDQPQEHVHASGAGRIQNSLPCIMECGIVPVSQIEVWSVALS